MIRLRKLLSESDKKTRHIRNLFNIHITFLGWLVECSGFLVMFIGTHVMGHSSSTRTMILQTLTLIIYFNVLPCVFLINNNSDIKISLTNSRYYHMFLRFFKCQQNVHNENVDVEDKQNNPRQLDDTNDDDHNPLNQDAKQA